MSNQIYIGFPTPSLDSLVECICGTQEPFTPDYFSWSERVGNKTDKVSDAERFGEFYQRAKKISFALLGNKVTYHVEPNTFRDDSRQATHGYLFVEFKRGFKRSVDILPLLKTLLEEVPGVTFGYACDYDESKHRHHLFKAWDDPSNHGGASSIEFTTGVDFRRYIPGIYWVTAFEQSYLQNVGLSHIKLSNKAVNEDKFSTKDGKEFYMYKFFDHAHEWKNHSSELDDFCMSQDRMFSLKRLAADIDAATSESDLDDIVKPWA